MKKYLKYIPCVTTLAIMYIIFSFSAQDATTSSQSSSSLIAFFISLLPDGFFNSDKEVLIQNASHLVRKMAHFTIYTALGISVFSMFKLLIEKIKPIHTIIISTLFCLMYAISDEIHQMFVPGRSCQISDIILDTSGALTGVIVTFLIIKILRRRKI